MFDLKPTDESTEPINLRLFLARQRPATDRDLAVPVHAAAAEPAKVVTLIRLI